MFDAGIFTNSANAPSWSIPIIRKFWQICASPSRHWWQWPQLTCISALTKSPAFTAVTSSPVRSTTPQNSCPSVTGGLIRPCDQRSHPYICKSVPQIEAVRTRTNTSPGPIDGTGAFSKESPRAACILRKAFIVDGMETQLLVGQSMLAHANSRGAARLQQAGTAAAQLGKISTVSNAWFFAFLTRSLHAFHNPDFLQSHQILHHHFQRHRPIFNRNPVPNLLRIKGTVHKIQRLIRVFLAPAPKAFVAQQLWWRYAYSAEVVSQVVVAEDRERAARLCPSPVPQVSAALHLFIWRAHRPLRHVRLVQPSWSSV